MCVTELLAAFRVERLSTVVLNPGSIMSADATLVEREW
jgi:hypothetical protein